MKDVRHVAFCGGGSGGHLTPAIAVIEALQELHGDLQVSFLTSGRAVDRQLLDSWTARPAGSVVAQLPLVSSQRRLPYAARLAAAALQCRRVFQNNRPDLIVGLGGFASLPGVAVGRWLNIPIALFEPNCVPGRANRQLARWAHITFAGWPMAAAYRERWRSPLLETGVPVRRRFVTSPESICDSASAPSLLVLGGSLGARSLNDLILQAVVHQRCLPPHWKIVHQTGPEEFSRVRQAYQQAAIEADVYPFIHRMHEELQQASLVVSRAGAVTLAEIAAVGRAALVVPLGSSADDHQLRNAEFFAAAGAAEMVRPSNQATTSAPTGAAPFTSMLHHLCVADQQRQQMAQHAAALQQPDAAVRMATELVRMLDAVSEQIHASG
ncbi:MAG: glycosyltransferase [Fuerstiella sp.]